ncbi:MAG: hypothetical protein ACOCPX_03215 [Halapricum sp.]
MAEFTFFEIHLDDASIEGSADGIVSLPFSSVTRDERDGDSDDSGGGNESIVSLRAVVLLAILVVAIAVLVRKRRSE